MNNIDIKKYKRFFAFGCSFTRYEWITWADIIAYHIKESYNYGRSGGGNSYIFYSLVNYFNENLSYESGNKLITMILLVIITLIIYVVISIFTKTFKISDIKLKY